MYLVVFLPHQCSDTCHLVDDTGQFVSLALYLENDNKNSEILLLETTYRSMNRDIVS